MKVKIFDNYIVKNNHLGKAVYAAKNYKKGDIIVMFEGPTISKKNLPKDCSGQRDRYIQIGSSTFMGPSHTIDDYINHSCDPNAGLIFRDLGILLVAIKSIKEGEEITWDYSTTIYKHSWKMKCDCRTKKCRGTVGEFATLPMTTKRKYFQLGILPPYIVKAFFNGITPSSINMKNLVYNKEYTNARQVIRQK